MDQLAETFNLAPEDTAASTEALRRVGNLSSADDGVRAARAVDGTWGQTARARQSGWRCHGLRTRSGARDGPTVVRAGEGIPACQGGCGIDYDAVVIGAGPAGTSLARGPSSARVGCSRP